jgi:hypothetical protein
MQEGVGMDDSQEDTEKELGDLDMEQDEQEIDMKALIE